MRRGPRKPLLAFSAIPSWCLALGILICLAGVARADVPYVTDFTGVADKALAGKLRDNSRLVSLQNRPPPSVAALRRRADDDLPQLRQILHDAGYWGAKIDVAIDAQASPAKVTLTVEPGSLYHLAEVRFVTPQGGAPPGLDPNDPAAFGLVIGNPAIASAVLDAETRITARYGESGRPFAKIVDRRVVVDDGTHTMDVTFTIDAGPEVHFGTVQVDGLKSLDPLYVKRRVTWREGALYDRREVAATRQALVDSNLFTVVQITHADAPAPDGTLPMTISLVERLPRSIGVGANYSTSLGFGASAFWEDRNLFGNAENLRITTQFAEAQLGVLAQFRRPDFLVKDQDLLASAELADETPIAYNSRRLRLMSGIERHLGPELTIGAEGDYEHGNVTAHFITQHYTLLGLPLYIRRDTTHNPLDPITGSRESFEITPYQGIAGSDLQFVSAHLSGSIYRPLIGTDRLVAAGYARIGSVVGESFESLPADKRLYVGGGGSVRGYGFQLVGPLDANNKPFGGRSSLEFGAELRGKITDTIGLVPFVDAGNVYSTGLPRPTARLFWGVGLGLRYYTAVGPIRLDVATPLSKRSSDSAIQIYISLGQAF